MPYPIPSSEPDPHTESDDFIKLHSQATLMSLMLRDHDALEAQGNKQQVELKSRSGGERISLGCHLISLWIPLSVSASTSIGTNLTGDLPASLCVVVAGEGGAERGVGVRQ
ncbi:predicted protein [Botrytis cinerea T4]|uniref:Uncharacterized protein n=1 Tax=Botryotinia fuckeliana (strain T4) TaxID=999810 RepID=G2YIM8_BOTF4|nr:predicted protein [Botrytis cinerea T4]